MAQAMVLIYISLIDTVELSMNKSSWLWLLLFPCVLILPFLLLLLLLSSHYLQLLYRVCVKYDSIYIYKIYGYRCIIIRLFSFARFLYFGFLNSIRRQILYQFYMLLKRIRLLCVKKRQLHSSKSPFTIICFHFVIPLDWRVLL